MKLLVTCLLLLTSSVFAETYKLAVITSEFDKDVMDFYVSTDDYDKVNSIRYVTTNPQGVVIEDKSVLASEVIERGVLLVRRDNYEAIRLEVEDFTIEEGGVIKLNYLYNGATGTRHIKRLGLTRMNDAFVLTDKDQLINRLFVKANWIRVLGNVGVREIQSSYRP